MLIFNLITASLEMKNIRKTVPDLVYIETLNFLIRLLLNLLVMPSRLRGQMKLNSLRKSIY